MAFTKKKGTGNFNHTAEGMKCEECFMGPIENKHYLAALTVLIHFEINIEVARLAKYLVLSLAFVFCSSLKEPLLHTDQQHSYSYSTN